MRDTKEILIEEASKLFWSRSYHSVSVDLICKKAGIKKGSFYHFFPSKEKLALHIIDALWKKHEDHFLKPTFDSSVPPLKKFFNLAKLLGVAACKMKERDGYFIGCPFGNLGSEMSTQNEQIRKKINSVFQNYRNYFIQAIKEAKENQDLPKDIDEDALSETILSVIQGSLVTAKVEDRTEHLENQLNFLFTSLKIAA